MSAVKTSKKEGFTPIPNELFEAITYANFSKQERKIIDVIIRKTYGFHKDQSIISTRQISQLTQINQGNLVRSLANLINHSVVITGGTKLFRTLQVNTNYTEWRTKTSQHNDEKALKPCFLIPKNYHEKAAIIEDSDVKTTSPNPTNKKTRVMSKQHQRRCRNNIRGDVETTSEVMLKRHHNKESFKERSKESFKEIRPSKTNPYFDQKNSIKKNKSIPLINASFLLTDYLKKIKGINFDTHTKDSSIIQPEVKPKTPPKPKPKTIEKVSYPQWLNIKLFEAYIENRKFIKSPMSIYAQTLAINKLKKLVDLGEDQDDLINRTIEANWKSFYPSQNNFNNSNEPATEIELKMSIAKADKEIREEQKVIKLAEQNRLEAESEQRAKERSRNKLRYYTEPKKILDCFS